MGDDEVIAWVRGDGRSELEIPAPVRGSTEYVGRDGKRVSGSRSVGRRRAENGAALTDSAHDAVGVDRRNARRIATPGEAGRNRRVGCAVVLGGEELIFKAHGQWRIRFVRLRRVR